MTNNRKIIFPKFTFISIYDFNYQITPTSKIFGNVEGGGGTMFSPDPFASLVQLETSNQVWKRESGTVHIIN